MIWQDYALAAINAGFLPTLIGMLRAPSPPPLSTSVPTAVLLTASAVVLATMGFWYTAACQGAMAFQWGWLIAQRMDE